VEGTWILLSEGLNTYVTEHNPQQAVLSYVKGLSLQVSGAGLSISPGQGEVEKVGNHRQGYRAGGLEAIGAATALPHSAVQSVKYHHGCHQDPFLAVCHRLLLW
jgi:hypothetical protein